MPVQPQTPPHVAPPRDATVSAREKAGLGLGRMVVDGSHGTLQVLVNPIYNMTLGVNPALLSTVVFLQRMWDAVLDPLVGHFSDNFRSPWGRRIPLMASAAFPLSLLFALIWWFPRGASEMGLFWHLLIVSVLFYGMHSLFAMPLAGLTIEATDDYHERTRVAAVTLSCGFAFNILCQWIFPLTQLAIFKDQVSGLRWITAGCAALFLVAALMPALLCRERTYARVTVRQPRQSLLASVRSLKGNRPFLLLLLARFIVMFGYNIVGMLGMYMNMYYVYGGRLKEGALTYGFLGSAYHIAAIASSLFIYPLISRRLGKKVTLQLASVVLMLGCCAKLVVYRPDLPWLQVIVLITNGSSLAGMTLMCVAMLGDAADADEFANGVRREASFGALMSWAEKAGNSLGSLFGGYVLLLIGFDARAGAQTPETLLLMKLCYFAAPLVGALTALILIHRYPLDEARMKEIRCELERRAAMPAT